MGDSDMNSLAKQALQSVPNTATIDDIGAILDEDGGVVIKNFLTADQVRAFNTEIDPYVDAQPAGRRKRDGDHQVLIDFHGDNTKRTRNLVNRSKILREEILDHDLLHAVAGGGLKNRLGSCWLARPDVIQIGPGNKAQALHRDFGAYPDFADMGVASPEIMTIFLIALTDFTDENGATRFIPGSHKWSDFEDMGKPEMSIPVEMKSGDALFYSGKVVHGGGANRTSDFYRRALSLTLLRNFLVPDDVHPLSVDVELVRPLPQRVQQILGFRSQRFEEDGFVNFWQVDGKDVAEHFGL